MGLFGFEAWVCDGGCIAGWKGNIICDLMLYSLNYDILCDATQLSCHVGLANCTCKHTAHHSLESDYLSVVQCESISAISTQHSPYRIQPPMRDHGTKNTRAESHHLCARLTMKSSWNLPMSHLHSPVQSPHSSTKPVILHNVHRSYPTRSTRRHRAKPRFKRPRCGADSSLEYILCASCRSMQDFSVAILTP